MLEKTVLVIRYSQFRDIIGYTAENENK